MQLLLVERGLISSICSAGDLCNGSGQGCNFWKLIGGAERGNMLKVPSKSFMATDFTSDLTHFLHNIVGAQLNIGVGVLRHSQRDIKLHLWQRAMSNSLLKSFLWRELVSFLCPCAFLEFCSIDETVHRPAWSSELYFLPIHTYIHIYFLSFTKQNKTNDNY